MNQRISPLLVRLVVMFTSCLMISNVLANRMIQVGSWSMDAGNLLFPVTYILSDVFSEVYGYKWSRRVTVWAVAMNLLFVCLVTVANLLPAPDYFDPRPFQMALGSSFRIVVASMVSYAVGDWVNDLVFRRMRQGKEPMEGFTARALASSLVGQLVDSGLFVTIAFGRTMPGEDLASMIALNIVAKVGYEIIILPLTYKVTQKVHRIENNYQNRRILK